MDGLHEPRLIECVTSA